MSEELGAGREGRSLVSPRWRPEAGGVRGVLSRARGGGERRGGEGHALLVHAERVGSGAARTGWLGAMGKPGRCSFILTRGSPFERKSL
jgi:hypothetical protein